MRSGLAHKWSLRARDLHSSVILLPFHDRVGYARAAWSVPLYGVAPNGSILV